MRWTDVDAEGVWTIETAPREKANGGVLELPDGATIEDALAALGLAVDRMHVTTVKGKIERDRGRTLSDGDELTILPPVGGG